ncbi:MAG: hypothetical protein AAFY15_02040 [Cyanobacteria bacterium J06648_11]
MRDRQSSEENPDGKRRNVVRRWAIAIVVYLCFVAVVCLTLTPSSWYWSATATRLPENAEPRPKPSDRASGRTSPLPVDIIFLARDRRTPEL